MLLKLILQAVKSTIIYELRFLLALYEKANGTEQTNILVSAIRNSFLILKNITDHTKTKIDDTIVDMVLSALPEEPIFKGENDSEIKEEEKQENQVSIENNNPEPKTMAL